MADHVKVMQLRHLARELSSALELALVGRAPDSIVDQLASVTGLLVTLRQLPLDTEPLRIWAIDAVTRAERAMSTWRAWDDERKAVA